MTSDRSRARRVVPPGAIPPGGTALDPLAGDAETFGRRTTSALIAGGLLMVLWPFVVMLLFLGLVAGLWFFSSVYGKLLLLPVGAALYLLRRRRIAHRLAADASATAAGAAPPAPRSAPAPGELTWSQARARFAALRGEYAAYECDATAVLRLPALSDVTVPSTARFVDAFAAAQTLETDAPPPAGHAVGFVCAVEHAERAWHSAREAAERIRLSGLTPDERGAVERVLKLLTTARDSDSEPERLSAYSFARAELAKLDRAGVIHLPHPARTALEAAGRRQLPT